MAPKLAPGDTANESQNKQETHRGEKVTVAEQSNDTVHFHNSLNVVSP